jgi:tetratricopeptide (TPR) repeat protein
VKKAIFAALACLLLTVTPSWGQEALEFYNRGLQSSLAYKRIEYFTKALQLDPNLAEAYEKRALHYYFQKRFDRAIQDYTRATELKPEGSDAYMMRGLVYLKRGHGEGFMAELKRLIRKLQKTAPPRYNEWLERAIVDFSRAIELDSQMASAYSYRAEAYRVKGMVDEAIRDSTAAIELRKDQHSTAGAYATRAEIYRRLGQNELYEVNLRKAVELDPYSSDYPPLHVPLTLRYAVDNARLENVRWLGLVGIIVLTFVVVFQLTLRAPDKRD